MRFLIPFFVLAGCNYNAPLDDKLPPLSNVVSGTVVAPVSETPAPAYVLVFDALNPGPPAGTGSPVTFATVAPQDFFVEGAGFQAAQYSIGNLPDGDYIISVLLDRDGNFNPFTGTLAGSTCGDVIGGYIDPDNNPTPISVAGGTHTEGVTLFAALDVAQQRPAFKLGLGEPYDDKLNAVVLDKETGQKSAADQLLLFDLQYTLDATKVAIPYNQEDGLTLVMAGPEASPREPCTTRFPLLGVDADGDGEVDLRPEKAYQEAGIANIWPRVFLEYLGTPTVDEDGVPGFDNPFAEAGETWVGENFPFALEHGLGTGAVFPGIAQPNVPTPVDSMPVLWAPVAKHYYADTSQGEDVERFRGVEVGVDTVDLRVPNTGLDAVPSGVWRITVMNHQGQIWQLPNEASVAPFNVSLDPANYDPSTQGGFLMTE